MLYRPIVKGWEYRGLTSFTMAPAGGLSLGYHYTLLHAFSCSTGYSALCSLLCAVLHSESSCPDMGRSQLVPPAALPGAPATQAVIQPTAPG